MIFNLVVVYRVRLGFIVVSFRWLEMVVFFEE